MCRENTEVMADTRHTIGKIPIAAENRGDLVWRDIMKSHECFNLVKDLLI